MSSTHCKSRNCGFQYSSGLGACCCSVIILLSVFVETVRCPGDQSVKIQEIYFVQLFMWLLLLFKYVAGKELPFPLQI